MKYHTYHPGIQNIYWTSGSTASEAWEKMRNMLERHHGGLAYGMLANCATFEDEVGKIKEWLQKVAEEGKAVRAGWLEVHSDWGNQGTVKPESIELNPPCQIFKISENMVDFLDADRHFILRRVLEKVDYPRDKFGQWASPDQEPECYWWYVDDGLCEGCAEFQFPENFDWSDFSDYAAEKFPDFFDRVGDEGKVNGVWWGWYYYTYRPGCRDQVQQIIDQYCETHCDNR